MHRMMQTSGASEGLRGLLDSSLMKSVKKILLHRDVFGANVLAIGKYCKRLQYRSPLLIQTCTAINIMSTFVHNEPTCLAVIQEAGLPEAFYKVVESGLEPVIEVGGLQISTAYAAHILEGHTICTECNRRTLSEPSWARSAICSPWNHSSPFLGFYIREAPANSSGERKRCPHWHCSGRTRSPPPVHQEVSI